MVHGNTSSIFIHNNKAHMPAALRIMGKNDSILNKCCVLKKEALIIRVYLRNIYFYYIYLNTFNIIYVYRNLI